MKTINKLVFAAAVFFTCSAATTQGKKPEQIIDTEYSTTAVVRDKIDRTIGGDKLVFGSVTQMKKQVGVDNVRIIQRKGAYNCARNEFIIKEALVFDKDGKEVKDSSIKTDVILTPDLDVVQREFNFMCAEKEAVPPAPVVQMVPVPIPMIIDTPEVKEAPKQASPKTHRKVKRLPVSTQSQKPVAAAAKPQPPEQKAKPALQHPLNPGQRTDKLFN